MPPKKKYNPATLEKKWIEIWDKKKLHKTNLKDPKKPKYYNLVMFPYPSGDKLHIGHWYSYAPADSWGRYMRMKGFEVFQPIGFDSFGLPAENYAIKTGIHPSKTTKTNTDYMRKQLAAMGAAWNWDAAVMTSSPDYYKWTQWIFLQLYKNGLAYRKEAPVNWCPGCQTVLANEQAQDGTCERCDTEVTKKDLSQWFFKLKKYAEKLLNYDGLDWPEKTKLMQQNWIGRSEGSIVRWEVSDQNIKLDTYTTTIDTIYGVTFVVISPEHPNLWKLVKEEHIENVKDYVEAAKKRSDIERMADDKEKTGVFTGSYVKNPLDGKQSPVWVADYVLMSYGTGVVMGVPAHDKRDYDFAKKYKLEVVQSVVDEHGKSFLYDDVDKYTIKGKLIKSGIYTGSDIIKAREKITEDLQKKKMGKFETNYKLRDWLLSRQRFWGAPIPIVHCGKCGEVPVPDKDLPVELPKYVDFKPKGDGKSPLATSPKFVNTTCPKCKGKAKRETDTMDTFVCSSWYYLRYPTAGVKSHAFDKKILDKWLPVDMYIGGPEHACMHLIYARFIHHVMHDLGYVKAKEPFRRLVHQGMITKDGAKMSKSKGNVVSPDAFVKKFGSDIFRMYLMFMGPFTQGGDWNDKGIMGVKRFADRFWDLMNQEDGEGSDALVHKTIKKVTDDMEKLHFNTVIAAIMELTNASMKTGLTKTQKQSIIRLLAPLAPHLCEEMWELNGGRGSVFNAQWPTYDESLLVEDTMTLAIQVNGKLRGTVTVSKDTEEKAVLTAAKEIENVAKYLLEGTLVKEIYIKGKMVSLVIRP